MRGKKTGGRQAGTPNVATPDIRGIAQKLLNDKTYKANLRKRLRRGIAGSVEVLLYHYAYGQPVKQIELTGRVTLEQIVAGRAPGDPPA